MAHFARLDSNKIVEQVIVISNDQLLDDNGNESEALGKAFCNSLIAGDWVQTSYNGKIRKNYAGIGFTYDATRDAFIAPKPDNSIGFNEDTCQWVVPHATEAI